MCYDYNCYYDCCNYYGYCPEYYSYSYSSYYNQCYYYYNSNNAGTISGATIGAVIAVIVIIIIICYCYRKRQQDRLVEQARIDAMNKNSNNDGTTVIITGQQQATSPQYGGHQPYNAYQPYGQQGYPQQPAYGQPAYGQQQPGYYGGQQNQQPIIITQ